MLYSSYNSNNQLNNKLGLEFNEERKQNYISEKNENK